MTRERIAEIVDDGCLVLGVVFVGIGVGLVSLAAAFVVVGALMLAMVTLPRLIQLWRGVDDRQ